MLTKIKYLSPIDKHKIIRISTKESRAHKVYPYSIDFIVEPGTPIKAAADGIVIDSKADSNRGGSARSYEKYENFVEIRHGDEYSYYGHLKKNGVRVKIGDRVRAGQIIGYSGSTGWLANLQEPHLHFMVGRYNYSTLRIRFKHN